MWGSIAVFIATEDGLCSFSDRHGSLFKIRLPACLGVFLPIPNPTAFFIHVSVCPLDIPISPRKDKYGPYGIHSLTDAMPCCAFLQPHFLQWHGLMEQALSLKHKHH